MGKTYYLSKPYTNYLIHMLYIHIMYGDSNSEQINRSFNKRADNPIPIAYTFPTLSHLFKDH